MILSKERAQQIVTLANREHWDGSGMREFMTPDEQNAVSAAMFSNKHNLSFNDVVRKLSRGEMV